MEGVTDLDGGRSRDGKKQKKEEKESEKEREAPQLTHGDTGKDVKMWMQVV